jgi:aspartokinase
MVPELCRLLSDQRINIAFMAMTGIGGEQPTLCCIDVCDCGEVLSAIEQDEALKKVVRIGNPDVGLLSVYPHQASLNLLGKAFHVLCENNVTVHGMSSSIGALTFVMDYDCLDKAVAALAGSLELDQNQIVRQPEYQVRQTLPADVAQPALLSNDPTRCGGHD